MTGLAAGLLTGRRIVTSALAPALAAMLGELGAELVALETEPAGVDATAAPVHGLVHDAGPAFAEAGPGGLATTLAATWAAVRAGAAPPQGTHPPTGGRIVLLAPAPDAGPLAGAAAAGVENLARTLSVEWARHDVTAVAIVPAGGEPGAGPQAALGELIAYLVSDAGDYLSGCRFDLSAPPAAVRRARPG